MLRGDKTPVFLFVAEGVVHGRSPSVEVVVFVGVGEMLGLFMSGYGAGLMLGC